MTDHQFDKRSDLIGRYAAIDLILKGSIMPEPLRKYLSRHFDKKFAAEMKKINDR